MPEMIYIQFRGADDEPEAAASRYHEGQKLPEGTWSVAHEVCGNDEVEVMSQFEMPEHWREQLKRWKQWGEGLRAPFSGDYDETD